MNSYFLQLRNSLDLNGCKNNAFNNLLPKDIKSLAIYILQNYKLKLILSLFPGCLISSAALMPALISAYVFDNIQNVNESSYLIMFFIVLAFIFFLAAFDLVYEVLRKAMSLKITHQIMSLLWGHIVNLPVSAFHQTESANLAQSICDYESAITISLKAGISLLLSAITLIALLAYMLYCNWQLSLIYFLLCILLLSFKVFILPANLKLVHMQMSLHGKIASFLHESLLKLHTIRSASAEDKIIHSWLYKLLDIKNHAEKSMRMEIFSLLSESIAPIILMLCMYAILYFSSDKMNTFFLIQFLVCTGQFTGLFSRISNDLMAIAHGSSGFKRMYDMLIIEPEKIINSEEIALHGDIRFSQVSFKSQATNQFILEDISFSIKPGEFVAFTGKSGAGKSTLFRLLLGLAKPCAGEITLDDISINYLNGAQIRKYFGVVLQDTSLFPGTIYSNIAIHPDITMEKAWQLAEFVGLTEEINAMPMKMHTYISDNAGESISGGQKQKILIARALALNPAILLLDEATSALDNKSQDHIHQHLQSLNITRIVIAHRLSTIVNADKIYVLDKGKIIKSGTNRELYNPVN